MATDSLILIGTDGPADAVAKTVAAALAVPGVTLGEHPDGRVWFRISETASAWLDSEQLDLIGDVAPEVVGARWQIVIRDTSGASGRDAVARQIYGALRDATDWQLVLMLEDWGPADAYRTARSHA
ncbi:hypothetical protein BH23ACT9_BH23ACT9_11840 [soil metagenome]